MSDVDPWAEIALELESLNPSSLAACLDPTRPYDGQPHTDTGERGRTEVKGITFRDLRDAFIRACFESSGLSIKEWPGDVYQLPWHEMDILAVAQNLSLNVEKAMGIYPNAPRLMPVDPTEPHWCGPTLDRSEWVSHEGSCDGERPEYREEPL
jgi:hypothetical protein